MPYIAAGYKQRIAETLDPLLDEVDSLNSGGLNYVLTRIVNAWLDEWKAFDGDDHYAHFNDAMGVLECVKQELYRRRVAPYEDGKAAENGDVYAA